MTLENNRAPLLYHIKLCASFQTIGEVKLELQSENAQFGSKSAFLVPCDVEIWRMTLNNYRAPLLCSFKLCAVFHSHWRIQTGVTVRKLSIWVKIDNVFICVTLKIWLMTLKNNRAPLLYYIKLCASFQKHELIKSGVKVWKRSIWVNIGNFLSRAIFKFKGWPWKTTGHLFYAASSFVHHFIAIGEFKTELQSRSAQFGSKSIIFCAVWPWNLTNDLEKQ